MEVVCKQSPTVFLDAPCYGCGLLAQIRWQQARLLFVAATMFGSVALILARPKWAARRRRWSVRRCRCDLAELPACRPAQIAKRKWLLEYARYWFCTRWAFAGARRVSLAVDATRIGARAVLVAFCALSSGVGAWAPPQVPPEIWLYFISRPLILYIWVVCIIYFGRFYD